MDSKTLKDVIKDETITKDLKEVQEDRFALQRMAEKVKELLGVKYVSILFDIKYPPKVGDSIEVDNLIATFKRKKI